MFRDKVKNASKVDPSLLRRRSFVSSRNPPQRGSNAWRTPKNVYVDP